MPVGGLLSDWTMGATTCTTAAARSQRVLWCWSPSCARRLFATESSRAGRCNAASMTLTPDG